MLYKNITSYFLYFYNILWKRDVKTSVSTEPLDMWRLCFVGMLCRDPVERLGCFYQRKRQSWLWPTETFLERPKDGKRFTLYLLPVRCMRTALGTSKVSSFINTISYESKYDCFLSSTWGDKSKRDDLRTTWRARGDRNSTDLIIEKSNFENVLHVLDSIGHG